MYQRLKHRFLGIRKRFTSGFTLPELLIVMTVIAGLASIMVVTYPATQKKARDTQRKSDLKQYQTTIEIYANKKGSYDGLSTGNLTSACTALGLGANCPNDPRPAISGNYEIFVNANQYVLSAKLERPQLDTKPFFIVCSNGQTGEHGSESGPVCPL